MADSIFRKETIDRVSSPEQLNEYIRVTNVGTWLIFLTLFLVIGGIFVWGFFGRLETSIKGRAVVSGGGAVCYLADSGDIAVGTEVRITDAEYSVDEIGTVPVSAADIAGKYDSYTAYSLSAAEWNTPVSFGAEGLSDGVYDVTFVIDSVSPVSFILN